MMGGVGVMALGAMTSAARPEKMMSDLPFAATTPISVARVGLKTRDADALAAYYRAVVGLEELARDGETITLGAANRPLLVLERDAAAKPDDPRSAGLFHTAFLLPSRADLGRWINHAIENKIQVEGASDHLVSEAAYLTDPEGNGIEIYADRPHESWKWDGPSVEMATLRMDIPGVVGSVPAGDAGWKGAPDNTVVGHVHLRVGDPRPGGTRNSASTPSRNTARRRCSCRRAGIITISAPTPGRAPAPVSAMPAVRVSPGSRCARLRPRRRPPMKIRGEPSSAPCPASLDNKLTLPP